MVSFRAMKTLVAAGLAVAALISAAPAHADNTTDAIFLAVVKSHDLPSDDDHNLILQANAPCLYMSDANGGTFVGELQFLTKHHPDWTTEDIGYFLGAANSAYCKDEELVPGGTRGDCDDDALGRADQGVGREVAIASASGFVIE
jgi:hypothetical protein